MSGGVILSTMGKTWLSVITSFGFSASSARVPDRLSS